MQTIYGWFLFQAGSVLHSFNKDYTGTSFFYAELDKSKKHFNH